LSFITIVPNFCLILPSPSSTYSAQWCSKWWDDLYYCCWFRERTRGI